MESSVNKDLLRSRVDTFILKSLSEKDGYGYDILRYIEEKTQGHYNMKQSSVYSVLKRLEKQGFIKSYMGDESLGGQRRYYSLTDKGRKLLEDEQQQWMYTRTLLDSLVSNEPFDLEEDTPPFKPSELRPLTRRSRSETPITNTVPTESKTYINQFDKLKTNINNTNNTDNKDRTNQEARQALFSNTTGSANKVEEPRKSPQSSINPEYKHIFQDIYKNQTSIETTSSPKKIPTYKDEEIDCHHINDLKNVLKNEGHILKPYKKDEILGLGKKRMVYSNRLFMDTSLLTFLFYALIVLIIYRFRIEFGYSEKTLLIIGLCGLVIPFVGVIKFFIEPKRRQRAIFNFKIAFSYSIMIFLLVFVINLIICLVTPTIALTIRDLQMYPPVILALFVPFSVIFYQLLYKSSIYKVKY